MRSLLLLFSLFLSTSTFSQSYTTWILGDPQDVSPSNFEFGLVLAGGGGDNDDAMQWMLNRADGGDVLIIRASQSDGYNNYFFNDLGVNVNSVRTIRFDDASAANDPFVLQEIQNAEVLFIAGGDQFDYYSFWKDTPVEQAINDLINVKGITVGGTSAGMAILGDVYYTPDGGSLTSDQALANPFHPNVSILGEGDFVAAPFLSNVVTDTHYDQRDRQPRHFTFIARMVDAFGGQYYGIACNEYTAVCIDETGQARVFGEHPEFDDFAYFLQSNCQSDPAPELIQAGSPLTWDRSQAAVKAYKVPGTTQGTNTFDLTDWSTGSGGSWENWYAQNGVFNKQLNVDGNCDLATSIEQTNAFNTLQILPNPFQEMIDIRGITKSTEPYTVQVFNLLGELVFSSSLTGDRQQLQLGYLPKGNYTLTITTSDGSHSQKIVKQH